MALGAVAGLVAAGATSLFQQAWTRARIPPTDKPSLELPPTEVLADDIALAIAARPLPPPQRAEAGQAIHYLVGAGLGAVYALAVKRDARAAAGSGVAYGLAVWVAVEEIGLALLRLKAPPWRVEPAEHRFAFASHVVFGLSLNATLALIAGQSPRAFQERHR